MRNRKWNKQAVSGPYNQMSTEVFPKFSSLETVGVILYKISGPSSDYGQMMNWTSQLPCDKTGPSN